MKLEIDRRVIVRAAVFTLTLVIPTYIVSVVIYIAADMSADSNFLFVPTIALFLEMALGGARAARLKPEAPFTHGALSALSAYFVFLVLVITAGIIKGGFDDPLPNLLAYVVFFLSIFGSAGIFGAVVATSQRQRSRARRRRPAHRAR